jgi:truncated hemoglobin YjbI
MTSVVAVHAESASIFERVGGPSHVAWVVDRLYERLTADPQLASSVGELNSEDFKAGLYAFLVQALGGPSPRRRSTANGQRVDLSPAQFLRFAELLYDTLVSLGLRDELLEQAGTAIVLAAMPIND